MEKWLSEAFGLGPRGEAVQAPGLSWLLLPSQPQSGVRQTGEREDGDAAPLCDGERRRGAGGDPAGARRGAGLGRLEPDSPQSLPQGSPGSRWNLSVSSEPSQPPSAGHLEEGG